MPSVDLVYDKDCPNIADARAQLMRAFSQAKVSAKWQEWDSADPEAPSRVRGYGSPTILVAGRDVGGAAPVEGTSCCRLYENEGSGLRGVPSVPDIVAALAATSTTPSSGTTKGGGWKTSAAMVPAVGMSLLPKVACPACWPAYAGFLSSVGLGFLIDTSYLLPLTAVFLAIAVAALAFRAKRRRGYLPFVIGLVASTVVLIGKFSFESDAAMYIGLAVLVAASLWNSWPKRAEADCPACVGQESPQQV